MRTSIKALGTLTTATALALTTAALGSAPAQAAGCSVRWGSTAKAGPSMAAAEVVDIRAGRHACFDRLVIDVAGDVRGAYDVRYVRSVTRDGSGQRVPLRGGADLQVVVRAPATPTDSFFHSNAELVDVQRYSTFRHVAWAGSFEGQTTVGLGVRARLPFRVTVLQGPGSASRLVVDVAHRW
ncbi:MAG: hypothetical protein JWN88_1969 [Frankiales bacterium]|jgi:hypothetical protein|nr:hypothetical protein [Frankiales bacterium]